MPQVESWPEDGGKGIDDALVSGVPTSLTDVSEEVPTHPAGEQRPVEARIRGLGQRKGAAWPTVVEQLTDLGIIRDIATAPGHRRHLTNLVAEHLDLTEDETKDLRDAIRGADRNETDDSSGRAADQLIEIGSRAELFHTESGEAFAAIDVDGHVEFLPVEGQAFEDWLLGEVWRQAEQAPGETTLASAVRMIRSKARREGAEREVHLRVCRRDEKTCIYDLADAAWRQILIGPDGWELREEVAVPFRRYAKTAAQVEPARGGSVEELWRFLRVKDEKDKRLIVAWLVAALIPGAPRPVLVFVGEHGTAKSTSARVLRRLSDPSVSEVMTPPENIREYVQSASHGHVLALDNVSRISQWLSDALCRASTGDAFEKRALFTNDEDVVWKFRRPVIINGIGCVVTNADLLDRSLLITLRPFEEGERRCEEDFWAEFEAARPRIFGALLDAISGVLRVLPVVTAPDGNRMADFARVGVALERVLEWNGGSFERATVENAEAQVQESIEASPVAEAVLRLLEDEDSWSGTATGLQAALRRVVDDETKRSLPRGAARLGAEITKIAPALRKVGIDVDRVKADDRKRTRLIVLKVRKELSALSALSAASPDTPSGASAHVSQDSTLPSVMNTAGPASDLRTVRTAADSRSPDADSTDPLPSASADEEGVGMIPQLLDQLLRRGVKLHLSEGKIRFQAPLGAYTPDLRALVDAHRDELVAHLRIEDHAATARRTQTESLAPAPLAAPVPWVEPVPDDAADRVRFLLRCRLHLGMPADLLDALLEDLFGPNTTSPSRLTRHEARTVVDVMSRTWDAYATGGSLSMLEHIRAVMRERDS